MRRALPLTVVLFGLVAACGRIGYTPLPLVDGGGSGGRVGATGGMGPGGATGGTIGSAGATGTGGSAGAAGTGGTGGTGGVNGTGATGGAATGGAAGGAGTGGAGTGGRGTGGVGTGGVGTGGAAAGGATGGAGTGGAGTGGAGTGGAGTGGAGTGGAGTGGAGTGGTAGTGGANGGLSCATDTFGGHTYAFCLGPLAWTEAANDCGLKGMRLVRIDDAAENTWLTMIAFTGVASTSSNYWSWIGGTDQAVLGDWRWSDGTLFWVGGSNGTPQGGRYNNWAAGSPTNGGGATDCAILEHATFWSDSDCTRPQRYICEQY